MAERSGTVINRAGGNMNIAPSAIAMVAGIAALECVGVVGMTSRTIQDGLSELFNLKDNLTKGIEVSIDEDSVVINLYVIVEYGVQIKEVANNVIERVRYAVENQLGLQVAKVNVIVQDIRLNKN